MVTATVSLSLMNLNYRVGKMPFNYFSRFGTAIQRSVVGKRRALSVVDTLSRTFLVPSVSGPSIQMSQQGTGHVYKNLHVAHATWTERLRKLRGGKVYVGLRIPDADSASRQSIDVVLVTEGELQVIAVKNFSRILKVRGDGSWFCEKPGSRHKVERHPDPVEEVRKQASILESYLELRGVALPKGYITCKVIIHPNPKLCIVPADGFPSEVIFHEQWAQLKARPKSMVPSWVKSAFYGEKKDMQESGIQNPDFVLSTAPIWDRLELKGNKYVLGEFLEFKGKQEDVAALRHIRRSKVSRLSIIEKTSMFSPDPSRLQVLYTLRDYRTEGPSYPELKEVTLSLSTEIVFQPKNASKIGKLKLSSVCSMHLSA